MKTSPPRLINRRRRADRAIHRQRRSHMRRRRDNHGRAVNHGLVANLQRRAPVAVNRFRDGRRRRVDALRAIKRALRPVWRRRQPRERSHQRRGPARGTRRGRWFWCA